VVYITAINIVKEVYLQIEVYDKPKDGYYGEIVAILHNVDLRSHLYQNTKNLQRTYDVSGFKFWNR